MDYLEAIDNYNKQYFKENIKIFNNDSNIKNIIIKLFNLKMY